ncbi:antitoxin Xre/MbcA/ParS toxin-binding domain-containing protein [Pseudomonas aeruginosa]|uniref:antitoxin Xre/MbcA/ParS toxin-binding domain-containing protein n=1 Tax=Pseudomonas aeruginosa TaxID=287 RepID=UPI004053AFAD
MDERLETILCSRYPKLLPTEGPGCFQLFGFECQDGWFGLIYTACELIQTHANRTGSGQAIASQVKEKFGGLRFYCRGGDDYVESVVELVERLSESICELCGAPGRIRERNGWLSARCQVHEEETGTPSREMSEWISQGDSMAAVLGAALRLFIFNPTETSRWLTSPARALGMKTPLEHLQEHHGHRDVMNLIAQIEYGVVP